MLSYQHIYHAGNPVDCQKHTILGALMQVLQEQHPAICYVDTHAGRGLYDLEAPEAQKIQEYTNGIDKIWPLTNWPKETRIFQHLLEDLNPNGLCRFYPGSPMVALAHARPDDQLALFEIHPRELTALHQSMSRKRNVEIYNLSGWDILEKNMRPPESHGVVLIDPSYEIKEEYTLMFERLKVAMEQWPQGVFMIWYPMLAAGRHNEMIEMFANGNIGPVLKSEIILGDAQSTKGLYGTGILMLNTPDGFDTTIDKISAWLCKAIGQSTTTEFISR